MARHFISSLILGSLVVFGASGCSTQPVNYTSVEFASPVRDMMPLHLRVQEIRVIHDYATPEDGDYVENMFPVPPAMAIEHWAADNLMADGGLDAVLDLVIKKAYIRAVPLAVTEGMQGWFYDDQQVWYEAVADVSVIARDTSGNRLAEAAARVHYGLSAAESNMTADAGMVGERINARLVNYLHQELDRNLKIHLAAFMPE